MVNAIYFKGAWLMQFERNETAEADFHAPRGTRPVQMMKTEKQFPVGHIGILDARVLKLPYKVKERARTTYEKFRPIIFKYLHTEVHN